MKMIDKYENVSQQDLHSFNKKICIPIIPIYILKT